MTCTAMAQEHKISVQKYELPAYSGIAMYFRGDVMLEFLIPPSGEVLNPKVVRVEALLSEQALPQSVIDFLAKRALDSIKSWRFHCDDCAFAETVSHRFTIRFDKGYVPSCDREFVVNSTGAKLDFPNRATFYPKTCVYIDMAVVPLPRVRSIKCLYLWPCKTVGKPGWQ
jgi:hypothetical protein